MNQSIFHKSKPNENHHNIDNSSSLFSSSPKMTKPNMNTETINKKIMNLHQIIFDSKYLNIDDFVRQKGYATSETIDVPKNNTTTASDTYQSNSYSRSNS